MTIKENIDQMLASIAKKEFDSARNLFQDIMTQKASEHLEDHKVSVANQFFNGVQEEVEQIDELSVEKMLAYGKAAKKDRAAKNDKWSNGKASEKDKHNVLSREAGEELAANKIKAKTGKYPEKLNVFDRLKAKIQGK